MTAKSQRAFVVCAPIKSDAQWPGLRAKAVETELIRLGNPLSTEIADAIGRLYLIHFMSMSVLWPSDGRNDAYLLMDVSCDSDRETVIRELITVAGPYFVDVARAAFGTSDINQFRDILIRHSHEVGPNPLFNIWPNRAVGLAFQGTPGLSVKQILRDKLLAKAANDLVFGSQRDATAYDCWRRVRAEAKKMGEIKIVNDPIKPFKPAGIGKVLQTIFLDSPVVWGPFVAALIASAIAMLFVFEWPDFSQWPFPILWKGLFASYVIWSALLLSFLSVVGFISFLAIIFVWRLRTLEKRDNESPVDIDPDVEVVRQIMQRENATIGNGGPVFAQNHMTGVSMIKPDHFRKWATLPFAFRIVEAALKVGVFKPGFLSKVGTIHFAQWIRVPGTRQLIFFSNYDGSWESYLEDFITKSFEGLNAIWSNTLEYPPTNWLFQDGATDGDRFKRWARRQQIPTLLWYSAYPALDCAQIRRNAEIREGLAKEERKMTPSAAEEWLRLFGSAVRPNYELERNEIQSLLLSGHGKLKAGQALLFEFDAEGEGARRWIADVLKAERVAFAITERDKWAATLAFSARGFERLGLRGVCDNDASGDFAQHFGSAFAMGMDDETRRTVLGDRGLSAPETWAWGCGDKAVDAVLLVQADCDASCASLVSEETERAAKYGLKLVKPIALETAQSDKLVEPFGFADGLSQPIIRGNDRRGPFQGKDVVEAGEFILGYPDTRHNFPPSPLVKAEVDTTGRLPIGRADAARDFGRNGSYLVIRQLEQDVKGFNDYAAQQAAAPHSRHSAEWYAAKMMGRWKNGAPLVRYPTDAPDEPYDPRQDQGFLYGVDDPQGLACPFGAHIRRANPRDSLDGDPQEIEITNRHRLMRRGRPYLEKTAEGERKGLLFMCFNADIQRQFEFVQQNWVGSSSMSALRDEVDPIATARWTEKPEGIFTIPRVSGQQRLQHLPSFVTVRGGAYFFAPGRSALEFLAKLTPASARPAQLAPPPATPVQQLAPAK